MLVALRKVALLAGALVLLAQVNVYAQDTGEETRARTESGSIALLVPLPISDGVMLGVDMLFHVTDQFALRPGISVLYDSITDESDDAGDETFSELAYELRFSGVHYFIETNRMYGYAGVGLSLGYVEQYVESEILDDDEGESYTRFGVTPLLGGQVMLHPQFGVFAETGVDFSFGGTGSPFDELTRTTIGTYTTRLGVAIYFN